MPLELEFTKTFDRATNSRPPTAAVILTKHNFGDGGRIPLVTERCGNFTEFSAAIDAAITKLEDIRTAAKSKFEA